ncbi:hypothetical protein JTE90_018196 [Oedothorax gibbosus]|uniref:Uncharacterized protein n=1 Tax=Oedothorax gibbosus TaxID=931172 RepID=A0AAV6U8B7_9ARAC|nr:hypothetical protein JTE90_018196 [Oedothorax gibbosus]
MILIKECSKREPNPDILSQKMDKTYYLRRVDIVSSRLKLAEFKEKWSMLFSPMQLRKEDANTFSKCMKNVDETDGVLSPHAVLVQEKDSTWSIMGENVLLLSNLDFPSCI